MASSILYPFLLLLISFLIPLAVAQQTCIPGTFVSGDSCARCPKQRVSMIANATECTRCDDGTIPARDRSRCIPCPPGRFFTTGSLSPCRRCPIDTFASEPASLQCSPCPDGTISTIESRRPENCVSCPVGTVVFRSRSLKRIRCNECPRTQSTFTINAPECLPCPKGQFRFRSGSRLRRGDPKNIARLITTDYFCRQCFPGTFSDETGSDKCTRCPAGTFQDEMGATSCKPCPPGSEATAVGARQCRPTCDTSSPECISCKPGTEFNMVTGKCEKCPGGTVSPIRSATKCFPCPVGESGVNDARTMCVCNATSRLKKNGECEECRSNFVALSGRVCTCGLQGANDDCECPPRTKKIGSKCDACDPATDTDCERCDIGTFTMIVEGINVCERCPQDTFNNKEDSDFCRPCPPGKSSNTFDDSNQCQCDAGLGLDAGECKPCPLGTFSPRAENKCIKCFSRSFNSMPGAQRCKNCPSARGRGAVTCET